MCNVVEQDKECINRKYQVSEIETDKVVSD